MTQRRGKLSRTLRLPRYAPVTRISIFSEHGFAGPCSFHWTTIPTRVLVRSSNSRDPRLRGRLSCTDTFGRLKTAGRFLVSPMKSAEHQMMSICGFVGIGRSATSCCFPCCQTSSPRPLSALMSAQRVDCLARSAIRTSSGDAESRLRDGIGFCQSLQLTAFDGKQWTLTCAAFCPSRTGIRHRRQFANV